MSESEQRLLLNKYINNQCSDAELKQVEQLVSNGIDDAIWQVVLQEKEQALSSWVSHASPKAEQRLVSILAQIQKNKPKGKQIFLRERVRWMAAAAAIIVVGILLSPIIRSKIVSTEQRELSLLATTVGEQKTLKTEDGSEIWINNKSSVKYPVKFSSKTRELYLEGEAFFQVKKDASKPFIVHASGIDIKVLGTSFNVQSYTDEDFIIITLATGKVTIFSGTESSSIDQQKSIATLVPGQQLSFNKKTNKFSLSEVDASNSFAWKEGLLVFNKEPLSKITQTLERSYGVEIVIENDILKSKLLTFKQKHESINTVLEILAYAGDFKYTIKGNKISIMENK